MPIKDYSTRRFSAKFHPAAAQLRVCVHELDNAGTVLLESHSLDADGNLIGSSTGIGIINPKLAPLDDNGGPTLTVHFRFPGHEKAKLINSPLGKIPEGWQRPFPDYVDFLEGPGLRRWQYRDEGIPFLNIRTIVNNDVDLSKCQYVDPAEVEQKYSHFLLRPLDHVVSSSGTIGRIATVQSHHLPLMLNTSIIRMAPKTMAMGRWQLKHFMQSAYFQDQIVAHASGVAQMNYGPSHLKLMWVIAPDETTGSAYEDFVTPLEEELCVLVKKNGVLRNTRDLLLPKLISGQLDVEELDIETGATLVEAVA